MHSWKQETNGIPRYVMIRTPQQTVAMSWLCHTDSNTPKTVSQIKHFLLYVALILVFYHCYRIVTSKLLRLIPEPTMEGEDRQPNIVL